MFCHAEPVEHDRFTAEAAENAEEIKIPPLTKGEGFFVRPARLLAIGATNGAVGVPRG